MKSIKFSPNQINGIIEGKYNCTWRLLDDKDLSVDDKINLVNSENGNIFAKANVDSITTKHLRDIDDNDKIGHIEYEDSVSMLEAFHKFYGPGVNMDSIVKVIKYSLIDNDNVVSNTAHITEVKLYTDGGSRGNPGPSASGFVILGMDDNLVEEGGKYLGITTNNQAEYQAVKLGLESCQKLGIRNVYVYMDSLLVVNQMTGIFKIKNRDLWPIHDAIKKLSFNFELVKFTHIPRELNKLADAMVNKILDDQPMDGGQSKLL